jgi:hypothetical protein
VFDYPTIHDLAGYIAKEILGEEIPATTNTPLQNNIAPAISSEVEPISEEDIEISIAGELAQLETLLKKN